MVASPTLARWGLQMLGQHEDALRKVFKVNFERLEQKRGGINLLTLWNQAPMDFCLWMQWFRGSYV